MRFFCRIVLKKENSWRGESISKPFGQSWFYKYLKLIVLPVYFSCCNTVLFSCSRNREYLEQYVWKKLKLKFFPCAVDYSFFRQEGFRTQKSKSDFKLENNISKKNIVITTCCRLTKRKRVDLIIRALSSLNNQNITLLVLGNGPERASLMELANKLNVDLRIIGFVDQQRVARFLSVSDIFVLMSIYDASPKVLNEALSFELPVVASEGVGTSKDLVKSGKNGFIIKIGEEDQLVEKLNYLTGDNVNLRSMGKNNLLITREYSISNDVNTIGEIIDG